MTLSEILWHRTQYDNLLERAQQFGEQATVVRSRDGFERELVQAVVVSAEEVKNNPAFADLLEREGIGGRQTQVRQWKLKNICELRKNSTKVYQRQSIIAKRKASNCRSSSSLDSLQNNSSVHKKKSKKGFVKNIKNNNFADSSASNKTIFEKLREFLDSRKTYSLYIWPEHSR